MLYVVRHGQTAANAAGQLLGRADVPLTDLGHQQATALAAALDGQVERVISSPLRRARDTAAAFGLPIEVDERWTELDYGVYDELPLGEVPQEMWERWRGDAEYAPPEGESLASVGRRVRAACDDLAAAAADSELVVVTHVSPIKASVGWTLDVGDHVTWRMFVAVASITRIALTERGPILRSFNEVAHLGQPS
ncbi:MAG: histidine phosphatase family protein [Acidimicrobiia bacterium]|nr:histidine phosphatase family protein [Acidimicrobiia bacterium]